MGHHNAQMTCFFFFLSHIGSNVIRQIVSEDQFATKDLNSSQTDTQVGLRFDVEKIGVVLFSFFFLKKKKRRKRSVSEQKFPPDTFREFTGCRRGVGENWWTGKRRSVFCDRNWGVFFLRSGSLHHRGNAQSFALPRRFHRHKHAKNILEHCDDSPGRMRVGVQEGN